MKTERCDALEAWLTRVGAEAIEQSDGIPTAYLINGKLAIVVRYSYGSFEILVPASKEPGVANALDGAALALDVHGARGLV